MKQSSVIGVSIESPASIKNKLTDEVWHVVDVDFGGVNEIDISFSNVSKKWAVWAREFLLEKHGGYVDASGTINTKISTFKNDIRRLNLIIVWATQKKGDEPMSTWSQEDLKDLAISLIFNEVETENRSPVASRLPYIKRATMIKNLRPITDSGRLYRQGKLSDGFLESISSDFLDEVAEAEFEKRGMADFWPDFIKDGTFAHIPVELSILLLAKAIDVIRSPRTCALRAYFVAQRGAFSQTLSFPNKYLNEFPLLELLGKKSSGALRSSYTAWLDEINNLFLQFTSDNTGNQVETTNSAESELSDIYNLKDLTLAVREVYDACLIIFLCLTGARIHEIRGMSSSDYTIEPDGTWVFTAPITKTQNGLKKLRAMSGLVAESANLLVDLSYIDKLSTDLHGRTVLFGSYISRDVYKARDENVVFTPSACSREYLADRVNLFYQKVKSEVLTHDDKDMPESVSPHGFRHAFVDFTLRRFDGNVLEAIRQHFAHHYGSSFTHNYTDKKAEQDVINAATNDYLKELIRRMIGEECHDFTGPMALYIRNEVKRLNIVTESQLSNFIDEQVDNLVHLVPHEYGFCLVLEGREHLAECKDKKTGIPIVENGKFDLCSRCANSCRSTQSHKSNIERIVISHESFLANFPLKTKQHEVSASVVNQGYKVLEQMEES